MTRDVLGVWRIWMPCPTTGRPIRVTRRAVKGFIAPIYADQFCEWAMTSSVREVCDMMRKNPRNANLYNLVLLMKEMREDGLDARFTFTW